VPRRHQIRARRLHARERQLDAAVAAQHQWVESGCRASSIRKLTPNLYDVQYNCEGEGEKWKLRVQFLYSGGDTLRMDEIR
jgi:hypothetical protein